MYGCCLSELKEVCIEVENSPVCGRIYIYYIYVKGFVIQPVKAACNVRWLPPATYKVVFWKFWKSR